MPRVKQNGLTTARVQERGQARCLRRWWRAVPQGLGWWGAALGVPGQAERSGGSARAGRIPPACPSQTPGRRPREYRQTMRDGVDPAEAKRDRAKVAKGIPTGQGCGPRGVGTAAQRMDPAAYPRMVAIARDSRIPPDRRHGGQRGIGGRCSGRAGADLEQPARDGDTGEATH